MKVNLYFPLRNTSGNIIWDKSNPPDLALINKAIYNLTINGFWASPFPEGDGITFDNLSMTNDEILYHVKLHMPWLNVTPVYTDNLFYHKCKTQDVILSGILYKRIEGVSPLSGESYSVTIKKNLLKELELGGDIDIVLAEYFTEDREFLKCGRIPVAINYSIAKNASLDPIEVLKALVKERISISMLNNLRGYNFVLNTSIPNFYLLEVLLLEANVNLKYNEQLCPENKFELTMPSAMASYDKVFLMKLMQVICPGTHFVVRYFKEEMPMYNVEEIMKSLRVEIMPYDERSQQTDKELEALGFDLQEFLGIYGPYDINESIKFYEEVWDRELEKEEKERASIVEANHGLDEDQDYDDDYDYFSAARKGNEKYGGYNGWSDDEIDEAFDGNPEATWNVD